MTRRSFDLVTDWVLACSAAIAFGTGLALFLGFHVGHGFARGALWGLGREAWLDVHRAAALATAVGMSAHVATHLRPLWTRLRRSLRTLPDRRTARELALYGSFPLMVVAGFVGWLALGSSGASAPGPNPHDAHHAVVDVHNISGLVALLTSLLHLAPRWRRLAPARWTSAARGRRSARETKPCVG